VPHHGIFNPIHHSGMFNPMPHNGIFYPVPHNGILNLVPTMELTMRWDPPLSEFGFLIQSVGFDVVEHNSHPRDTTIC
jgi:hypothetical protein